MYPDKQSSAAACFLQWSIEIENQQKAEVHHESRNTAMAPSTKPLLRL